jgi:hypothetical protein
VPHSEDEPLFNSLREEHALIERQAGATPKMAGERASEKAIHIEFWH